MKKTIRIQNEVEIEAMGEHYNGNAKHVLCITTGEVFASVMDASEHAGCASSTMSVSVRTHGSTCKGKQYCLVKDIPEYLDEITECIRKANEYDKIIAQKNAVKNAEEEAAKRKARVDKLRAQLAKEEEEYNQVVINLDLLTNANNAVCMA